MGEVNGGVQWQVLELYNDVTRTVAEAHNVFLVDLAGSMPKDSAYYYDYHHFSNDGALVVADIVAQQVRPYLRDRFAEYAVAGESTTNSP